jgi:hypothetical protein
MNESSATRIVPGSPGRRLPHNLSESFGPNAGLYGAERFQTSASNCLLAARLEAKILTEKRHYMILETIGYGAGMRAGINLKAVCNSITV